MTGAVIFCGGFVLVMALIIICTEVHDRKADIRRRKVLKAGIHCKGVIQKIERKGPLESRNAYPWRITVRFEYVGKIYTIEEQSLVRPKEVAGDRIAVYVDCADPERSFIII